MTKLPSSVLNMPQCVGLLVAWFWASAASEGNAISPHVEVQNQFNSVKHNIRFALQVNMFFSSAQSPFILLNLSRQAALIQNRNQTKKKNTSKSLPLWVSTVFLPDLGLHPFSSPILWPITRIYRQWKRVELLICLASYEELRNCSFAMAEEIHSLTKMCQLGHLLHPYVFKEIRYDISQSLL